MGTVVYQGLHESSFEPMALRLRLSQCGSSVLELPLNSRTLDSTTKLFENTKCQHEEISQKTNTKSLNTSPDCGAWSFLQALENTCDNAKESKKQSSYVHPLVKGKSSTLSDKSLELCTESLGSETGTDIIEDSVFTSLSESNYITPSSEQKIVKPRQVFGGSFPPPLTTMSGSKSIKLRPHREDGRLVIEAIEKPSTQTYFHAERSHGRLRLSLVNDFTSIFDSTNVIEDRNEQEEIENDVENYEEYEEQQQEEVYEEEMEFNNMKISEEMGIDEFQRPSRCKQGELENHKGLIITYWKHLCWLLLKLYFMIFGL